LNWMLDAGCWMLDAGCWLLVAGCWMLVAGCWMLVKVFGFSAAGIVPAKKTLAFKGEH